MTTEFKRVLFSAVFVACNLLPGAALAQVAANSCWGNCGMHALSSSGTPSCACDPDCEKLGDCCEDKHTVCPVNALNTTNLCPLLQGAAMYGTDLGFNFINGGTVNVLFGDTWSSANTPCELPPNNDDAQATLPIARPAALATVAGEIVSLIVLIAGLV